MKLVSYEQIAADAGISIRTVIRDVQRRLLTAHRLDGRVWIDADAPATAAYLDGHRKTREGRTALGRRA